MQTVVGQPDAPSLGPFRRRAGLVPSWGMAQGLVVSEVDGRPAAPALQEPAWPEAGGPLGGRYFTATDRSRSCSVEVPSLLVAPSSWEGPAPPWLGCGNGLAAALSKHRRLAHLRRRQALPPGSGRSPLETPKRKRRSRSPCGGQRSREASRSQEPRRRRGEEWLGCGLASLWPSELRLEESLQVEDYVSWPASSQLQDTPMSLSPVIGEAVPDWRGNDFCSSLICLDTQRPGPQPVWLFSQSNSLCASGPGREELAGARSSSRSSGRGGACQELGSAGGTAELGAAGEADTSGAVVQGDVGCSAVAGSPRGDCPRPPVPQEAVEAAEPSPIPTLASVPELAASPMAATPPATPAPLAWGEAALQRVVATPRTKPQPKPDVAEAVASPEASAPAVAAAAAMPPPPEVAELEAPEDWSAVVQVAQPLSGVPASESPERRASVQLVATVVAPTAHPAAAVVAEPASVATLAPCSAPRDSLAEEVSSAPAFVAAEVPANNAAHQVTVPAVAPVACEAPAVAEVALPAPAGKVEATAEASVLVAEASAVAHQAAAQSAPQLPAPSLTAQAEEAGHHQLASAPAAPPMAEDEAMEIEADVAVASAGPATPVAVLESELPSLLLAVDVPLEPPAVEPATLSAAVPAPGQAAQRAPASAVEAWEPSVQASHPIDQLNDQPSHRPAVVEQEPLPASAGSVNVAAADTPAKSEVPTVLALEASVAIPQLEAAEPAMVEPVALAASAIVEPAAASDPDMPAAVEPATPHSSAPATAVSALLSQVPPVTSSIPGAPQHAEAPLPSPAPLPPATETAPASLAPPATQLDGTAAPAGPQGPPVAVQEPSTVQAEPMQLDAAGAGSGGNEPATPPRARFKGQPPPECARVGPASPEIPDGPPGICLPAGVEEAAAAPEAMAPPATRMASQDLQLRAQMGKQLLRGQEIKLPCAVDEWWLWRQVLGPALQLDE